MLRLTLLAVAVFASAPLPSIQAQAPRAAEGRATTTPGTIRPGTYDLDIAFGGGSLEGTLVLTASGDSLAATMHVGDHEVPIRGLTRDGSHLQIRGGVEGMAVVYDLDFTPDGLSGKFTYNGDPGLVTGKRRK